MSKQNIIAGIDVGGSHVTVGLVNMNTRKVIENTVIRKHVDCHAPAEEILNVWTDVIKQAIAFYPGEVTKAGFAMPGPFDYPNGICLIKGFNKYELLYGLNIREELAKRIGLKGENIKFRNDAEAFLEGEVFGGAAQGFNHAIGITLGTGLGSAIFHDGVTIDAELSPMPYEGDIIEALVSTRGLVRIYRELTGIEVKDAKAIADIYNDDPNAAKAFKLFSKHLSWFLTQFIKQESPEVLVIGGNIAQSWDLFIDDVKTNLSESLDTVPVIVKAMLSEDAALVGGVCSFLNAVDKISVPVN